MAVYDKTCSEISLADFIVISAEAMMYRLSDGYDSRNKFYFGSLGRKFRDNFRWGRRTATTCDYSVTPNADSGCQIVESKMVKEIFGQCIATSRVQDGGTNDGGSGDDGSDTNSTEPPPPPRTMVGATNAWETSISRDGIESNYSNAWMYSTALMGGHTIGGANFSQSGYYGNFTGNATDTENMKFNNKYYL